jgi:hypothetical protein
MPAARLYLNLLGLRRTRSNEEIMGESEFKGMPNALVWADRWRAER